MFVIICMDSASAGFGFAATPKGWGGREFIVFGSHSLAWDWAWSNIGPNKEWRVAPLGCRVVVASPW